MMTNKIILIADSGSTNTNWCLLHGNQQEMRKTQGISPYFLKKEDIRKVLSDELQLPVPVEEVQQIYFYGTGLAVAEKAQLMKEILSEIFQNADIEINHDLTGAARALCQHEEGLACILGTGSGSCYYDGKEIRESSPGLGFILGDEGSGAYMGKILIQKYLYKTLGEELTAAFEKKYQPSKADILKKVYQEPYPNRYLASYARFLGENRGKDAAESIIKQGIRDFLTIHVKRYPQSAALPVHFLGGIADAFHDVVTRLCVKQGLRSGRILKDPMDGLIAYHSH